MFQLFLGNIEECYDAKEYEWKRMYLPNTVYLSLYIKRLDDLFNRLLPGVKHRWLRSDQGHKHDADLAGREGSMYQRLY